MRHLSLVALLLLLPVCHILALDKAAKEFAALPKGEQETYQLPGPLMKITSLEFDGIASDFLFLKALVFIGKTIEQDNLEKLDSDAWGGFASQVRAVTYLDPYFVDPYYLGNAYLPWYAGMVNETDALLDRGSRYRTWDWEMPFLAGFNCFYFLQDNDKAAQYLMEASRRPGATPVIASLASKLAFKAKRIETSILFLEEMRKKTDDETAKSLFKKRIEAFKAIFSLEKAVKKYRKKFGKVPARLDELVKEGVLREFPRDPYGGTFYLDASGWVHSTTEQQFMPHVRSAKR